MLLKLSSFINFSLAVSSPLLEALEPAIEGEGSGEPIWIWQLPNFALGWFLTDKNSFFLVFSISRLIRSFWMLYAIPAIL